MEDLERITALILFLRKYPAVFRRACILLGRRSPVVTLHGLPLMEEDLLRCRRKCHGVAYDREALHEEIDREIDVETRWRRGFLTYLTSQGRLYEVLPTLMTTEGRR